jgi:hypothetical protein
MPVESGVYEFQQKCCSKEPRDRPEIIYAVEFFHKLYEQLEQTELDNDENNDNQFYGKEEEGARLINEIKQKQSTLSKNTSIAPVNHEKFSDV